MGILSLIPGFNVAKLAVFGLLGALVIGGVGYGWWRWHAVNAHVVSLTTSNAALTRDVAKVAAVNSGLASSLQFARVEAAQDAAALNAQAITSVEQAGQAASASQAIADAPASANGPVAPVLAATLRSLAADQGQKP